MSWRDMRKLLIPLALLMAAASAQTAPPQGRPDAPPEVAPIQIVPIDQEPAHKLVFENEYVRVFSVEVAPHTETKYHQHDRDYVWVSLGDSDVESVRVGAAAVSVKPKDGETQFTKGGFAHKAVNKSDKPFRNVTVELKKGALDINSKLTGKTDQTSNPTTTVVWAKNVGCWRVRATPEWETTGFWVSRKYLIVASDTSPAKPAREPRLIKGLFEWGETEGRGKEIRFGTAPAGATFCLFGEMSQPKAPRRQKKGARDDEAKGAAKK